MTSWHLVQNEQQYWCRDRTMLTCSCNQLGHCLVGPSFCFHCCLVFLFCFVFFVLCLVCPKLPVCLDCPFLIVIWFSITYISSSSQICFLTFSEILFFIFAFVFCLFFSDDLCLFYLCIFAIYICIFGYKHLVARDLK
jgi:hypothetical protein